VTSAGAVADGAAADERERVAVFRRRIGRTHLIDAHTHFMPGRLLAAVWAYFDAAGPLVGRPWPIRYRQGELRRIEVLRGFGVRAFTSMLYPHKPGMARSRLPVPGRARATVTRRLCTITGFCKYAVEEELPGHSLAAHVRRPRLNYQSHAAAPDRNELGALPVAAGHRHAFITAAPDAGVPLRDVQEAACHADPRTTMRYDKARTSLDRHATYIAAASRDCRFSPCSSHRASRTPTVGDLEPSRPR
jgi:hypothetical protein